MLETNSFIIGQTVYIDGHEMTVTQMRVDHGVGGVTGLIWLSDPILYEKDKMDREAKEALVHSQKTALDTVTRVMNDGE